jgi:hypothetical protein
LRQWPTTSATVSTLFQTQATYDVRAFSAFADHLARSTQALRGSRAHGVIPVEAVCMVEYMNHDVPHIGGPNQ